VVAQSFEVGYPPQPGLARSSIPRNRSINSREALRIA
jgi:hypothetical protein